MLENKKLITDSQMNNKDLVHVLMKQTLEQITTLTGLSKAHAVTLMTEQLSPDAPHQFAPYQPVIEQEESLFIHHLFN
jgi:hypothetical protein